MFGVIFLQYCSYSCFYILDEMFKIAPSHFKELVKPEEAAEEVVEDVPE